MIFFHVGWAKPVPINPVYYKDRKKGIIQVSLAGPLANIFLAFLSILLEGLLMKLGNSSSLTIYALSMLLEYSAKINLGLAIFNLIPIPPLDGSKIAGELSYRINDFYMHWMPYWKFILFALVVTGIIGIPLSDLVNILFDRMWKIIEQIFSLSVIENNGQFI